MMMMMIIIIKINNNNNNKNNRIELLVATLHFVIIFNVRQQTDAR